MELTPIDEEDFEPPSGKTPGRILVHVLSACDPAVSQYQRWETEVLDWDGDSAVF